MTTLDANHGHLFNGIYHYHGSSTAPYMIGNMVGVVTEDATNQIIPQAQSQPVRTENWGPLNGALITACVPNGSNNGYNLSYTLNGTSGYATNYSWTGPTYTFNYGIPSGTNTISYNGFSQCDVPLSVTNTNTLNDNIFVYPNPFVTTLTIANKSNKEYYTLSNSLGQIVFAGKNIEQKDFSNLEKGMYFLEVKDTYTKTFKLFKQ